MSSIDVTLISVKSAQRMAEIEQQAHVNPWPLQTLKDCFSGSYLVLGVFLKRRLVGYLIAQPVLDEVSLLNVCIEPKHQRQGLGRILLERFMVLMRERGIKQCFLDVRASNQAAQNLYQRLGFAIVGRRKNYYTAAHDAREDALMMTYDLAV